MQVSSSFVIAVSSAPEVYKLRLMISVLKCKTVPRSTLLYGLILSHLNLLISLINCLWCFTAHRKALDYERENRNMVT